MFDIKKIEAKYNELKLAEEQAIAKALLTKQAVINAKLETAKAEIIKNVEAELIENAKKQFAENIALLESVMEEEKIEEETEETEKEKETEQA